MVMVIDVLETDKQLATWEASRNLEAELVKSVGQMKQGKGMVVHSPVISDQQKSKNPRGSRP